MQTRVATNRHRTLRPIHLSPFFYDVKGSSIATPIRKLNTGIVIKNRGGVEAPQKVDSFSLSETAFTKINQMKKSIVVLTALSLNSQAQMFTNGTLDGTEVGQGINGHVAPGWTINSSTPDLNDAVGLPNTTPGFDWLGTPLPSPSGGTFHNTFSGTFPELFGQTVAGFTVGVDYDLSFEYAYMPIGIPGFNAPDSPDFIFSISGATINSGSSIPQPGTAYVWESHSVNFTANSTSHTFEFGVPGGTPGYGAWDNFVITSPIPEPSSAILLGFGALGILGRRKRIS